MPKAISAIWLVKSLTKNEKKIFCLMSKAEKNNQQQKDYVTLYTIIEKKKNTTVENLAKEYQKKCPHSSFHTTASYLFDALVSTIAYARRNSNNEIKLYNMLIKARILFEKSIYDECFVLIEQLKTEAIAVENNYVLLMAKRMELDFRVAIGFTDMNETTLLNLQASIGESIKNIRILNEQSSLYELLKYRIEHRGMVRSAKQKNELNDLVVSELSILSRSGSETSQIKKTHKLFQSYYLLSVGDYHSAINSFGELMNLLENNISLWNGSPIDYLLTTEGILKGFHSTRNPEGMRLVINKLKAMDTTRYPLPFQIEIRCVTFVYTLSYLLDTGKIEEAMDELVLQKATIYDQTHLLGFDRQVELALYMSIVYFVHGDFSKALKQINYATVSNKSLNSIPLYKTIRLLKLIIHKEMDDLDYILSEGRSIQRSLNREIKNFKIEPLIFKMIHIDFNLMGKAKREALWIRISPQMEEIRHNKFEMQVLRSFDFTAWIEAKIIGTSLAKVLKSRMDHSSDKLPEGH
jgi:hypothetical protein